MTNKTIYATRIAGLERIMAYIVMDAPGYYGTYAQVFSRHRTLAAAIRAAKEGNPNSAIVSTDRGFADSHQPGAKIHRSSAESYEILWSAKMEAVAKGERKSTQDASEREERIAKLYGRGSNQYHAALQREEADARSRA
jgi:hypothetical protein